MLRLQRLRQALRPPHAMKALSTAAAEPTPMANELLKYAFGSLKVASAQPCVTTLGVDGWNPR